MRISYKFRLYPSKQQKQKLLEVLDKCRFVYNQMLDGLNKQKKPNRLELQNSIPKLKEKHSELKEIYSKVLQYESYRLFSNLRALVRLKENGKRVGRLRFKGKRWFKTFTYNQSGFKIVITNGRCQRLHLSKIGDIPIRMHRKTKGKIKQVTIKRYRSGKWFALIFCELKKEVVKKPIKTAVGIDMGIIHYAADSNGRMISHPHILKKSLKKLKREQRRLSKARKSNNRNRQRIKLARAHEKITNQRNDFLHKQSRRYVDDYDFIAVEKLQITNMVKNHYLARSIMDSSWSRFIQFLFYKAVNAGEMVVEVNPRGTSIKCSRCGEEVEKNLVVRTHRCPFCGLEIDRDYNSAVNILKLGLEIYRRNCGMSSLLETRPLSISGQVLSVNQEASSFITR